VLAVGEIDSCATELPRKPEYARPNPVSSARYLIIKPSSFKTGQEIDRIFKATQSMNIKYYGYLAVLIYTI
jgi:hypothetical protein